MQNIYMLKAHQIRSLFLSIILILITTIYSTAQFDQNNLAIVVAAASANNTTASIVEINKTNAGQTAIQSIVIPGTGTDAIRVSGSATSTLYASNSDDGTLFCFAGHNNTNTGSNANTLNPRAVVTVNNAGTINLATTYTGASGNQTRCATTLNNSNWFIGDQGGFYTNNATSASPTGNIRSVKAFGGTVYAFTASATNPPVGTISAPSGGTYTALPGLPNGATSRQDFYLISSGTNGSTYDILYVLDATSATAGTILKYSLVGGTWTANGTYSTGVGGFGMCAEQSGMGANLYITTGTGATVTNSVRKLEDAAGYNTSINISSTTTLFTTATGTIIKGIAFAPKAPLVPVITVSGTLTSLSTTYGTPSSNTTFTVEGENLVANLVVTAPTGFEVSTSADSGFGASVSLTPAGGIVSITTIYARLAANATVAGSPYSGNIVCSSTNAVSQNVATEASSVSVLNVEITGASAEDKIYDGTDIAEITGNISPVNGDIINVTGGGTFAQLTVGVDIAVTATLSLSGTNASSYNIISQPMNLTASITPKTLTISGITVEDKVFDGNTDATLSGTPALIGVIPADVDDVILGGTPVATFDNIGPGQNIPVSVTGYSISGSAIDNYTLTQPTGFTANISPLVVPVITISGTLSAVNTTYGTPSPTPSSFTVEGDDLIDDITVTAPTGFEVSTSINSGYSSSVVLSENSGIVPETTIYVRLAAVATVAGSPYEGNIVCSSSGATSQNVATASSTVAPLSVTTTGAVAENKIYDGNNTATLSGASVTGAVNGDNLTVSGGGTFDNKNTGTDKPVTANLTLNGDNTSSYTLTQPTMLSADITPKQLTITSAVAQNKPYDGTTNAVVTGTLTGVIAPDEVDLSITGMFASPNIGNNIEVTSTATLSGADTDNYSIMQLGVLTANITPIALAIWTYEPLQGTASNPTPNIGSGSSSVEGSMTGAGTGTGMNTATGCGAQTSGTTAWAIGTANPGSLNESSGVRFNTSTVGYTNIRFTWEQRWSNTATNTVRLQYTLDGTTWNNFDMTDQNTTYCLGALNNGRFEANTTGDQFRRISVNLSAIQAVNDNPNFGVRLVAAHYQNTGQFRQTATPASVASAGTWRFDNVKFESYPGDAPLSPLVNLSVSANNGYESESTQIIITATASAPVTGHQTVNLSISGTGITSADYFIRPANITIPDGQTTGTATFVIADDTNHEATETATISISSASAGLTLGSTLSQDITIFNNDCSFLRKIGSATSIIGAEIPAFDPSSNKLYVVAATETEIYSVSATGTLTNLGVLPKGFNPPAGTIAEPNSVAIKNGVASVAYAVRNTSTNAQEPGVVAFYQASNGSFIHAVNVGYLPDMLTFSPDGTKVLTADEGEPNSYGQVNSFDPEGSVSIIDISGGIVSATVQIVGFGAFNSQEASLKAAGVRIFGPGATVAQDLEPEYIAFSADGTKAFVTLQENNAFAVLDIPTATFTDIIPLGLKDFNAPGNTLDVSDQDGAINMQNWPVFGMYMPDAIASYTVGGNTYYITANEGDARDYTGYSEEIRVNSGSYPLDPAVFPDGATLKQNANLGRLQVSRATGDMDNNGLYERIDMYGARSFSIWNDMGALVFDSGNELELLSAQRMPSVFNSDGTVGSFDTRSDNKGPEPEGVCIGNIEGQIYAFIGIERTGDVAVYNVTDPLASQLVQYINLPEDLNVEGLIFVSAEDSPTGVPLLITAAEVSKTISVFEIGKVLVTNTADSGSGTLRAALACVIDGGTIEYDQPTITSSTLISPIIIDKNVTILGQNETDRPVINVDFTTLGMLPGVTIENDKNVIFKNVDMQGINNTNMPKNDLITIKDAAILKVLGTVLLNE